MDINDKSDAVVRRMQAMIDRVAVLKEHDLYFYNQPVEELRGGARVVVNGRDMGMYASYSYLGLVGHPRINKAAQDAVAKYGTGTHGVRTLAGRPGVAVVPRGTDGRCRADTAHSCAQVGRCDRGCRALHMERGNQCRAPPALGQPLLHHVCPRRRGLAVGPGHAGDLAVAVRPAASSGPGG